MQIPHKPTVLIILDGWGIAPPSPSNPITIAKTPNFDWLISTFPTLSLQASGEAVGLPWGEMGNSEVGHLNLGAGRIVYQDLPRISRAITDSTFFKNDAFLKAIEHAKQNKSTLHIMGLTSSGGVHSSIDHLEALIELAKQSEIKNLYLHLFLDGRDAPRDSGLGFVQRIQKKLENLKIGKIASLSGRFYAMDRDNRWDREERAYKAIVFGEATEYASDPLTAIKHSYAKGVYDEEFIPTVIGKEGKPTITVKDDDAVIFFNFRPDRARQLTKAFVLPGFDKFSRPHYLKHLFFVTMTEYDKDLPVVVAFPPELINFPMGRLVSELGLKQLHIAETEKYAHVSYFFNGGNEVPYKGQDNVIIPSPGVSSYDQKPGMSADELTTRMLKEMAKKKYDFIVANYANADMVGHTGNIDATVQGVEAVDECLGKVVKKVLEYDGLVFITADHGNGEELTNLQTGALDKEHSVNPVPFIAVSKSWEGQVVYRDLIQQHDLSMLPPSGILSDVAVTILTYMGIAPAEEMTGHNLLLS